MILIKKQAAPQELEALKSEAEKKHLSDSEAYNLLRNPLKQQVRESLMQEQGHLCAYCMRRIPDERVLEEDVNLSDVYIEHWQARSSSNEFADNKGLDYQNMLAVCSGNEKATGVKSRHKKRYFTCDKKRENRVLTVNPLDAATLTSIYYLSDGTIKARDLEVDKDLNTTLNLNCNFEAVTLRDNRKAVLEAVQEYIVNQQGDFMEHCKEQLSFWENEGDPKTPFIGIAIWWLKEQIASEHLEN